MSTLQEERTLEERVKAIEVWGENIAIVGNYNASRIHSLEMEVSQLKKEFKNLKKNSRS